MSHRATVVGLTDVGKTRSRNEDSLSVLPEIGVALVADGMGGHPGGDVASSIAAETVAQTLGSQLPWEDGPPDGERLQKLVRSGVIAGHEAIRTRSREEPKLDGMGTTLTVLVVSPDSDAYVLGHVGDSRAYRLRGGELVQLTRDDTWVQERIESRQLTEIQARQHRFAHMLTQCLGLEQAPVPHVSGGSVDPGDHYLLCTDGLVGMLDDDRIRDILLEQLDGNAEDSASNGVRALVDAANDAGGHDNVTVVLVTIETRSDG